MLASSSPYRRMLLDRLHLPYQCSAPEIDESRLPDEPLEQLVQRLARQKAEAVHCEEPALIIGSDQLAALDGQALGKPGRFERAREQLLAMRGRSVDFLTAVHVRDNQNGEYAHHLDITRVHFRTFSVKEAEYYLQQEQPWNCAGSFKSEGLGIALFEAIENRDPTALIGLPMIALCKLLQQLGYPLLRPHEEEHTP